MAGEKTGATPKIHATRNYRLFKRSMDNRVLDLKAHKRLRKSMEKYGYLPCFPIVCHKNGDSHLVVKEGQHRLTFAEQLGLPVYYITSDVDFDVAEINCTPRTWRPIDYARKFAQAGNANYQEGIDFAERHGIPIGMAFCLLSGNSSFTNIWDAYTSGKFRIKDREWANQVAGLYTAMTTLSKELRGKAFLMACLRVCRVEGFEPKRMLQNAQRCRERLVSYSTADAYLGLLEEVYNLGRHRLFGLRIAAQQAMKERNPTKRNEKAKELAAV